MFRQYIDIYNEQRSLLESHAPDVMNACRAEALQALAGWCDGLPVALRERFRYTPLRQLMQPEYGLNLNRLPITVDHREAFRCGVPGISDHPLLVINDQPQLPVTDSASDTARMYGTAPATMSAGFAGGEATVTTLSHLAEERPDLLQHHYARMARPDADPVTALNTLLAQDGLAIVVPRGTHMAQPLQVINLLASPVDMIVNRRLLIIVEPGADAQLLFCDHLSRNTATQRFLTTQVVEVCLGQGAQLDLFCMEETGPASTRLSQLFVEQQRDSRFTHHVVTLQNGLTRNQTDVQLLEPGAQAYLGGCVIADGQQHVENNTLIRHAATHCDSRELYKYVLDGQATGAFAGRVLVEEGAQQTTSKETNQNLCASADARMYTQPMLEIYADDVQCSHGSTVGQLNDQALFYMQQRGIPLQEARTLLQMAFLDEVIDGIRLLPLRQRLHHLVERRFRGKLKACDGCRMCD